MRRDLEEYLISLQKQYNTMNEAIKKANKQIEDGILKEDSIITLKKLTESLTINYKRVLYCRYLYNLPPKFIQKLRAKKLNKKVQEFMTEHSDKDSVITENEECLNGINEVLNKDE